MGKAVWCAWSFDVEFGSVYLLLLLSLSQGFVQLASHLIVSSTSEVGGDLLTHLPSYSTQSAVHQYHAGPSLRGALIPFYDPTQLNLSHDPHPISIHHLQHVITINRSTLHAWTTSDEDADADAEFYSLPPSLTHLSYRRYLTYTLHMPARQPTHPIPSHPTMGEAYHRPSIHLFISLSVCLSKRAQ